MSASALALQWTMSTTAGGPPPPLGPTIISFSANPSAVNPGGSSTLSWTISDATAALLNTVSVNPVSGSYVVTPQTTTNYTLVASNAQGSSQRTTGVIVYLPPPAGVPWAGIIAPTRAIDWRGAGISGGIPNWTEICDGQGGSNSILPTGLSTWQVNHDYPPNSSIVINPSTITPTANETWRMTTELGGTSGTSVPAWNRTNNATTTETTGSGIIWRAYNTGTDLANIVTAMTNCSSNIATGPGKVVQLEAGLYIIRGTMSFNKTRNTPIHNVVLRGRGADKTRLLIYPVLASTLMYHFSDASYANVIGDRTWIAGYQQGETTLTLGCFPGSSSCPTVGGQPNPTGGLYATEGVSVGNIIFLDQRDDTVDICPLVPLASGYCTYPGRTQGAGTTLATIVTRVPHGFHTGWPVGIRAAGGYNVGTATPRAWATILDVGCIVSDAYVAEANCGSHPIVAFRYHALSSGLEPGGGGQAVGDTGGVLRSAAQGLTVLEGAGKGRICPSQGNATVNAMFCEPNETSRRTQAEIHRIVEIHPETNQIVITPPLESTNWRAEKAPHIWWTRKSFRLGMEDLTIDTWNGQTAQSSSQGVEISNCYECWIKGVRTIRGNRNAIRLWHTAKSQVQDNYVWGTKGGASTSYGIETDMTSDNLIQNNMCENVVSCTMNGYGSGDVFAYNWGMDAGNYAVTSLYCQFGMAHNAAQFSLWEGNTGNCGVIDTTHTTLSQLTMFRNRLQGYDDPMRWVPGGWKVTTNEAFSRGLNWIGNILGWPGMFPNYQSAGGGNQRVYAAFGTGVGGAVQDAKMAQTMLRWGNYDTATQSTRWCGTGQEGADCSCGPAAFCPAEQKEVPTEPATFIQANPVPANHDLPPSFYLAAPPAWWRTSWGTPGWPPIGPDVNATGDPLNATCDPPFNYRLYTGPYSDGRQNAILCNGILNFSYRIPAQLCAANTPVDSAYQRNWAISHIAYNSSTSVFTFDIDNSDGTFVFPPATPFWVTGVTPASFNRSYVLTGSYGGSVYGPNPTATTVSANGPTGPTLGTMTYIGGGTLHAFNIRLFNAEACYPDDFPAAARRK